LGLIRLEFEAWEDTIAVMSRIVVRMPPAGKPKLLDQRVKASLTRQEWRPADALCVCAPLTKRQRILHWLLG